MHKRNLSISVFVAVCRCRLPFVVAALCAPMSVGFLRIIQIRLFEQNTLKSVISFCEFRICRQNHSECASGGSFFAYFLNVCKKYGRGWGAQRSPKRQRQM